MGTHILSLDRPYQPKPSFTVTLTMRKSLTPDPRQVLPVPSAPYSLNTKITLLNETQVFAKERRGAG